MRVLTDTEIWALQTSMPGRSSEIEYDDDDPRYVEFMRVHEQLQTLGLLTCDVSRRRDPVRNGEWTTWTFRTTERGKRELQLQLAARAA